MRTLLSAEGLRRERGRGCRVKAPRCSQSPCGPGGKRTKSRTLPDSVWAGSWGARGRRGRLAQLQCFPGRGWAGCSCWGLRREKGLQLSRQHCHGRQEARGQRRPRLQLCGGGLEKRSGFFPQKGPRFGLLGPSPPQPGLEASLLAF